MAVTILGSGTSPVVGSRTLTNFGTGTEYSFSSGLTNTNNAITLGGTLLKETNIVGGIDEFPINMTARSVAAGYGWIRVGDGSAFIRSYPTVDGSGTTYSNVYANSTNAAIQRYESGAIKALQLDADAMTVTDAVDTIGLQYATDYSTNGKAVGSNLWIPDWASVIGYNTFSNGLTSTAGATVLGGPLTAHTVIGGQYNLTFGSATKLDTFTASTTGGVNLLYTEDTDETSISIAGTGINVTDEVANTGFVYADDYTTAGEIVGDRWIPDKGWVDAAIAEEAASYEGHMRVAHHQVVFGDESSDYQIVTLDADDVVWQVKVYVSEAFNDGGYDRLSIGKSTLVEYTGDEEDTTVLLSTGWTDYTTGVPDKMTGSQAISIVYEGEDQDADAGVLDVYIHYTKH